MDKMLDIKLAEALKNNEITELSELEKICIPKIKSGRDLLCVAGEGCGKTTTIVVSVLQRLKKSLNDTPRAVIIVPDTDSAIEMKNDLPGNNSTNNNPTIIGLLILIIFAKQSSTIATSKSKKK